MSSGDDGHVALVRMTHARWDGEPPADVRRDALPELERGDVLFFPALGFELTARGRAALSPATAGASKNVSFDPATGKLSGAALHGDDLRDMLSQFSRLAALFVGGLLPQYRARLVIGRASFRPVEIAGRQTSWRRDDTRLHVDAFPATPSGGRRILRLFTNVNPDGRPRRWRVGERFEAVAGRFAPTLRAPLPGSAHLRHWLHLTKTRRTPYDAMMLQLHDRMKEDLDYQARCPQAAVDFAPGSTWVAFTDQVAHAAMAGQYQLEQTFLVPVDAMQEPERSPLRVLERLKGRRLL